MMRGRLDGWRVRVEDVSAAEDEVEVVEARLRGRLLVEAGVAARLVRGWSEGGGRLKHRLRPSRDCSQASSVSGLGGWRW